MNINPLTLAFISAAGGVLVSSVFTIVGPVLARKHKSKEIIFNAAIAQAKQRVATCIEIAKLTGQSGEVPDEAVLAGTYYGWYKHLFEHGTLPETAIDAEKESALELKKAQDKRSEDTRLHNARITEQACMNPLTARHFLASTKDFSAFTDDQYKALQAAAGQSYP
jgi:hypothetical protein